MSSTNSPPKNATTPQPRSSRLSPLCSTRSPRRSRTTNEADAPAELEAMAGPSLPPRDRGRHRVRPCLSALRWTEEPPGAPLPRLPDRRVPDAGGPMTGLADSNPDKRPCECDAPRCEREGCQDKPTPRLPASTPSKRLPTYGRRERFGPYWRQAIRFIGRTFESLGATLDSWSWG